MRRIIPVLILLLACLPIGMVGVLGVVGCGGTPELKTEGPITKQQAIEKAVWVFQFKGGDLDRYNMTVEDKGNTWLVIFMGKDPCPLVGHMNIFISKKDGAVFVEHVGNGVRTPEE